VIIGDLAHSAVTVAVYVAVPFLLVFAVMTKVIGLKRMLRRRRPRRERSRPREPDATSRESDALI